jgi:hypothetical protein
VPRLLQSCSASHYNDDNDHDDDDDDDDIKCTTYLGRLGACSELVSVPSLI